ncbi:Fc.00g094070.m01.CDS01 [Cosmosporella sp. VM-42]
MAESTGDPKREGGEHLLDPSQDAEERWDAEDDIEILSDGESSIQPPLTQSVIIRLYISHFLSTWNSRLFEFGSVLFLTSIYPDTLMPVSIYALVRAATAIVLSPAIGLWIDKGDRLFIVRVSIIGERTAIAISCAIFLILEKHQDDSSWLNHSLFSVIVVLAGVEKLCSIMNSVSVTRDWVVEITEGHEDNRRTLNAQIRRIDLSCKLLSPFLIASIDQYSTIVAIWTTMLMNFSSIFVEYTCIEKVYNLVPRLHQSPKKATDDQAEEYSVVRQEEFELDDAPPLKTSFRITSFLHRIFPWSSFALYIKHQAFLPSFSYAFLHFTVLSFSGRMIAFLLASGFSSFSVGVARTVSTVAELSATWISPRIMKWLGSIRSGSLSIAWQTLWLTLGVACFLINGRSGTLALLGLIGGVVLSRIGLWGFDLAIQSIIQDEVESSNRGAFSTAEASTQNLFELLSYLSTIIFARPSEFHWPILMTMVSAYAACATYTRYVYHG